jgi:preprotein translocase subunit SecG
MKVYNKMKWALGILLVFIIVLITNLSFFRQKNSQVNDDIQRFIDRFEETKITKEERVAFNSLINHVENLQRLESEYMDSKFRDKSELLSLISDIKDDLYDLSKVQLKEGKRQMSLSEKTMDTIELFTQVEIIFLIVMAVLIQLIVLYQPKDKKQSQAQE